MIVCVAHLNLVSRILVHGSVRHFWLNEAPSENIWQLFFHSDFQKFVSCFGWLWFFVALISHNFHKETSPSLSLAEQRGERVEGGGGGGGPRTAGGQRLGDVLRDPRGDHRGGGEVRDGGRVAEPDLDLLRDCAGDHSVLDHGLGRHHLGGTISSIQCIPLLTKLFRVTMVVGDYTIFVDFILELPPSCPTAMPFLPSLDQSKQNLANSATTKLKSTKPSL